MLAALFALSYGMLLFALSAEADTPFLEVLGVIAAVYMTVAGAYVGWRASRSE